jgi:hypothetical protein
VNTRAGATVGALTPPPLDPQPATVAAAASAAPTSADLCIVELLIR